MRAGNREKEEISRPAPVRTPATTEQQLRWALSRGEPAEPPVPGGQMGPGPGLRIPAGLRGQDGETRTRGAFLGLQFQKASSDTPGLYSHKDGRDPWADPSLASGRISTS